MPYSLDASLGDRYVDFLSRRKPKTVGDRVGHAVLLALVALLIVVTIGAVILLLVQFNLRVPDVPEYLKVTPFSSIAIGIAFLRYQKRKKANTEETARLRRALPVWATIVMANEAMFKPGPEEEAWPALVLVTFDQALAEDIPLMAAVKNRLFYLQQNPSDLPAIQEAVTSILTELPVTRAGQRTRLPDALTDGIPVFAVDIFIRRAYLKNGYLTPETQRIPCLIEPGDGKIWHVPYDLMNGPHTFA